MQGRLLRRIDMALLDLAVNYEACASARGQQRDGLLDSIPNMLTFKQEAREGI